MHTAAQAHPQTHMHAKQIDAKVPLKKIRNEKGDITTNTEIQKSLHVITNSITTNFIT